MSEQEATLDEFTNSQTEDEDRQVAPPTELTGVPDDWVAVRLDDVAVDKEGAFVDGPFGSNLKADEMFEEGYARIIQLQNIRASEFVDTNHKYVSREKFEELERHGAKPGDLAIAKMSEPVARACLLPEIEDQYIVVADCIKSTVDKSDHNSVFVMLAMNSNPVWKQAFARSRGSTRKRINLTQLKEVQIPSPSLEEQRKIASVLYTVDQAIQKTEETIKQYQRVKKGVSQNLLKTGIYDHELEETDTHYGKLPSEWSLERLADVTDIVGRTEPPTDVDKYWGGEIPWATLDDIRSIDGPTIRETEQTVTEVALDEISSNLVPPGSVLLTTRATVGLCAINEVEMTTARAFKDLIPGEKIDTWYLYYRIASMEDYLNRLGWGSTFTEVIKPVLENVTIPAPPLEEQKEIGERLHSIDRSITKNTKIKNQYQRLKQGLMQDLLSGDVRTHDKDIELVEDVLQHG